MVNALSPPHTCSRTFSATADRVGAARRFLVSVLDGCPAGNDAVLCLSELASNAIRHSNSARPGGQFTARAILAPGRLRVEVEDQGGLWQPSQGTDGQGGRGLLVVDQLTTAWGISGDGASARVAWFEITCPCPASACGPHLSGGQM